MAFPLRVCTIALLAALPLIADDRWIRIRSGPFEIMTAGGEKPARDLMLEAEQFRWAFSQLTGVADPTTVWPIRLIVLKKGSSPEPSGISTARDSWISAVVAGQPLTATWRKACARLLIDDNTGRMPAGIERGLISLLSTLDVNGTRLTLGVPPPPDERTKDWARLHFFTTNPEYQRRSRVMLSNLARGADYEAACRNAFERSSSELDKLVDAHLASGKFEGVPFSGRPLAPTDFTVREAETYDGRIAMADLLLANPERAAEAEAAYKALNGPEATEGLAFLAQRRKDPSASKLFQAAVDSGSKNPRAMLATGTKEGAIRAIETNPKWADPHIRLAELGTAPNVKAVELGKAAALAPRDAELWKAAALAYAENKQFAEATKAWAGAERAAASEEDRARIREFRMENDRKRAEFEAAERKRIADEEARALAKLRNDSLAEVRAAEAKANKELQKDGPVPTNVQPWWDGPGGPAETLNGSLQRVDCLAGGRARLIVQTTTAKTAVQLLVRDPKQIVITGAGELSLGCGIQKPARSATIEYAPTRDARLGTRGEVRLIEFK